jgi:hypothetical protein
MGVADKNQILYLLQNSSPLKHKSDISATFQKTYYHPSPNKYEKKNAIGTL